MLLLLLVAQLLLGGLLLFVELLDSQELLLLLHSAVLEPDLDLPLRQAQHVGQLDAAPSRKVAVELELLLQLQSLEAGVGLAASASLVGVGTWNKAERERRALCREPHRQKVFSPRQTGARLPRRDYSAGQLFVRAVTAHE